MPTLDERIQELADGIGNTVGALRDRVDVAEVSTVTTLAALPNDAPVGKRFYVSAPVNLLDKVTAVSARYESAFRCKRRNR
jgi:hypothetical protein